MIWRPKPGARVELHYRKTMQAACLHMQHGTVITSGGRKIVNALVRLDNGNTLVVPRGNLMEIKS